MSAYQLIAPLTEMVSEDHVCESTYCKKIIRRGSAYYPVKSFDNSRPAWRLCHDCFEKRAKQPGTAIRAVQPPDPKTICANIIASQSGSVNPPPVVPISNMPRTNPPPPPAQSHHARQSNPMLPPSLPVVRASCPTPTVHAPAAWPATQPILASGPSRMGPLGYSEHHASYPTELRRWSGYARGTLPPIETISLSLTALHEGGQRRGRLNGVPFGNIVEGKKGINAHITASGLVAVSHETIVPLIVAFCPDFDWRVDQFMVRDGSWVDLANHLDTVESRMGYFYQECVQCKGKGSVFKTRQFPVYVVVPQLQWTDYEEFVARRDGTVAQEHFTTGCKTKTRAIIQRRGDPIDDDHHALPGPSVTVLSSADDTTSSSVASLRPLFTSSQVADYEGQQSIKVSSPVSIKRSYIRSDSPASITAKSPPTKKPILVKTEPISPDRDGIREALRIGGKVDLDTQFLKHLLYQIDFFPIPTMSIKLILKNPNYRKFDLDPKKGVTVLHPGQVRLRGNSESFMGAGTFKTAHKATLVLSNLTATGIGSRSYETIIIKQSYNRRDNQLFEGPFKCYGIQVEYEKLLCEANILYWAKALFKLTTDFIAKRIASATEPPPFSIPLIWFVDAAFALRYPASPVKGPKAPSIDCSYLCKEEITDVEALFITFIHNGNCIPLVKPGDRGYDIAQFLVFTQHVQYVKTDGLAYISDYQGSLSLLTDPQILTHPDIGNDLFGEGNIDKVVGLFEKEHICNEFCRWPGCKLPPLGGNWKGKGKVLDTIVVSSESDLE